MEKVAKWMGPLVRGMMWMSVGAAVIPGAQAQEWKPAKPVRRKQSFNDAPQR